MVELVQTRVATLGDVAEFIRGITFKPEDIEYGPTDTNVDCLRTKNVQATLDTRDVWAIDPSFVKRPNQYVTEGDILISSANSWNLVGKCSWIPSLARPTAFGGFVTVLRRRDDSVDSRYLYHWFSSARVQRTIRSFGNQTTNISNLDLKRSASLTLPLPPLDEQRRIAAVLDKADGLRTKRRQALALLDVLTRSIFHDMFGSAGDKDMATVPVSTFGEVLNFRTGKLDSNAAEPNGKYPFFTCAKDISYINEFAFDQEALLLAGNNASGTYDVKRYRGKFNAYQRTYVIDIDKNRLAFAYVHAVLEDRLEQMRRSSRGSGTKYLTLSILRPMSIPIPPLRIQDEFERRVAATERLKDHHRAQLAQLDALFASLQQRAFEGRL